MQVTPTCAELYDAVLAAIAKTGTRWSSMPIRAGPLTAMFGERRVYDRAEEEAVRCADDLKRKNDSKI
ncbi:MAG: hypothetical protein ACLRSW_06865 [Christensenellaceae bacterium]